ncbi:uncharacterized protein LOC110107602 [Dendrobium catenatum]|uniref:uncharacterized protein LOC110107602 n=1 Tax=Dendrobium catenatum TaxID=906689 RepID=UPI0009F5435B|nr:uncharacterized protein LOC110107602 [Dendrobium catenatum]
MVDFVRPMSSMMRFCEYMLMHARTHIVIVYVEVEQVELKLTYELKEASWIDPILTFLQDGVLPEDPTVAVQLRRQAANFTIINGELYKRSFTGPYLKCLPPSEANYALREVHSGICGEHLGGRALAQKVLRQGFYWPTMKQDALELVRKSTGQRKFIILAVDYFTKWVEAEPLTKITEANVKQFIWKNIIYCFGIPVKLITDNGTQFTGRVFTIFCKDLHIQLVHTAVAHPQTNGQTEVTNRTILRGLKTRLDKAGGQWADELLNILLEAVIPVDIGVPSHRVQTFDLNANDKKLRHNLDLFPEARDEAMLKVSAYYQRVVRYYNKRMKPRRISIEDLVLRSIETAGKGPQRNKFSPL